MTTTKFTVGIPRLNEAPLFLETLRAIEQSSSRPDRVIIVDNGDRPWVRSAGALDRDIEIIRPRSNIGVAASWNMLCGMSPWPTILVNADCAVATDTFVRMLAHPGPTIVCAYGFACFRIDPEIRKAVGGFDEGFYPGYWEDADYRRRCELARVSIVDWATYPRTPVAVGRERSVHGIVHGKHEPGGYQGWSRDKIAWLHRCIERNRLRYIAKWGGALHAEMFSVPFDGASEVLGNIPEMPS